MKVAILDGEALRTVTPAALCAYARALGWRKMEEYGAHSDIYDGDDLPEIIVPRTERLGDYASVVSQLIEVFAEVTDLSQLIVYRDLMTADRDAVRVRAGGAEIDIPVNQGVSLFSGARDMLLAAACSLKDPQPFYRAGANQQASEFLQRVRFGQTEPGSFVVTLLTPTISPPLQQPLDPDWPAEEPQARRVSKRLVHALDAARQATELTAAGDAAAFSEAVESGVSANLCDAIATLAEPFSTLDVSVSWARTLPENSAKRTVEFARSNAPILREAARSLRDRAPRDGIRLVGFVQRLKRNESEENGTVWLRTRVSDRPQAVMAVLRQSAYDRAIDAHREKAAVIVEGDLQRFGQRWHLGRPRIVEVIDPPEDGEAVAARGVAEGPATDERPT